MTEDPYDNPKFCAEMYFLDKKKSEILVHYIDAKNTYKIAERELDNVNEEITKLKESYGIFQNVR